MRKPNVLVVVMDTTRADHLSCYGYDRKTTPNLDQLADEGTRFENAISPAGWTLPAHTSLFSGLLPSEHGVLHGEYSQRDGVTMFPEQLSEAGYRTAAFSNNPWVSASYEFDRGIDHFVDVYREHVHKYKSGVGQMLTRLKKALLLSDTGAASTNRELKTWLEAGDDDTPFFAFLNYMEPHQVYTPRRPYHRKYLDGGPLAPYREVFKNRNLHRDRGKIFAGERELTDDEIDAMEALYDGELSCLDAKLGELFEWLQSEGLYEETFILVVGDHGEAFCEHEPMGHQIVDHHFALYDSIVRVPMIARLPDVFEDETVDAPVQLTDVPPTLSDIVDDPAVDLSGGMGAQSLCDPDPDRIALSEYRTPPPQIESLREHAPSFDWSQYEVDLRMARSRTQKLVRYLSREREELYDLADDPGEQFDVRDSETPDERLEDALAAWNDTLGTSASRGGAGPGQQDGDVQEHLKDLGYL
jgi:arylsulfatase A-like enzyme